MFDLIIYNLKLLGLDLNSIHLDLTPSVSIILWNLKKEDYKRGVRISMSMHSLYGWAWWKKSKTPKPGIRKANAPKNISLYQFFFLKNRSASRLPLHRGCPHFHSARVFTTRVAIDGWRIRFSCVENEKGGRQRYDRYPLSHVKKRGEKKGRLPKTPAPQTDRAMTKTTPVLSFDWCEDLM